MAVNDITDFKKCAKKFDTLLTNLGYKSECRVQGEVNYYLGDHPEKFIIRLSYNGYSFSQVLILFVGNDGFLC